MDVYLEKWNRIRMAFPNENQVVPLTNRIREELLQVESKDENDFWTAKLDDVLQKVIERSMLLQLR
jgi:hypothetical protein